MGNLMELGIWDECGHQHENFMKVRRVLPCLAVVLLDSGAHALVGLDGGDELQEVSHVFASAPKLEPYVDECVDEVDEAEESDEQFARWEAWFEVAAAQMEELSNSFNLTESFYILSDALEVGLTMDEQFNFWFYNRIAAAVELMEGDPVRGQYEYPTTQEQLASAAILEEVSGMQGISGIQSIPEYLETCDNMFVEPEVKETS